MNLGAEIDDQAPTVPFMSPGDPVSGSAALTADASDDQGSVEVCVFVDGALIGSDATPRTPSTGA